MDIYLGFGPWGLASFGITMDTVAVGLWSLTILAKS